jgi:DNA polymerase-4
MERIILHCDLNKFYASVEHLYHPELRGRPIAVGGDPEARHGIVLTADALAKARGVKTGMALWQAKQVCPEITFVPPHMELYQQMSKKARGIYRRYSDRIEPFGIDEVWLELTGCCDDLAQGYALGDKIRRQIKEELGLTISVGVSWNKVLAKYASDYRKPDAVTLITKENLKEIFWPAPVEDLLYVGRATQAKLNHYCIRTIGQLACADPAFLHRLLGKMGDILYAFANGRDQTPVSLEGTVAPIKSVGNSITTPRDLTTEEEVKIVVYLLCESVAARMREDGSVCQTVELTVRDNSLFHFSRQQRLSPATDLTEELARAAMALFRASYDWQKPIRSIGVRGCQLVPRSEVVQYDLFTDQKKRDALQRLDRTVDTIRGRFGYTSVQRGLMYLDRSLSSVDAKREHVVHPRGYFDRGNQTGLEK